MINNKIHYFDNSATTMTIDEVAQVAMSFATVHYYNPSSNTNLSIAVHKELQNARNIIKSYLNWKEQIIFTSGGTEADNIGILGSIKNNSMLNIVTSKVEHPAVYNTINSLKNRGFEVRYVECEKDGHIMPSKLAKVVDVNTQLVALMHVNNETGAINDITSLSKTVKEINKNALFFCDGIQAYGKMKFNLMNTNVDIYTISSHKIHGLKGVGAVLFKNKVNINAQVFGGGQEFGYRSGTENTSGIMAFAKASQIVYGNLSENIQKYCKYKEIIRSVMKDVDGYELCETNCISSIISFVFKGIKSEIIQHILEDDYGIVVGIGSACNSKNHYNRTLSEIGVEKQYIEGLVRISFSQFNDEEEVELLANSLRKEVIKLQKIMRII